MRAGEAAEEDVESLIRSGDAQRDEWDLPAAEVSYRSALDLAPNHPIANLKLLATLQDLGRDDEAIEAARSWRSLAVAEPVAQHTAAALLHEPGGSRAPDGYVTTVFDNFSSRFNKQMALLDYRGPALIGVGMAQAFGQAGGLLEVLDAGCGTGLCGPVIRPYARRVVGVDLSAGMLAQVPPGIYDELERTELTAYLMSHPNRFDAIVAADTLIYFGDLASILAAFANALSPGGYLIFTLEAETEGNGHKLTPSGRYSHDDLHARQRLIESGLNLCSIQGEGLRYEGGPLVRGFLVTARKPAAND